jgi:DNA-binding MarR family transcriptional regulator
MVQTQTRRDWTFLSNHGHVLIYLYRHPDARVREVAAAVGVTERTAQAILADLVAAGYLKVHRVGRRNSYTVSHNRRLRHPEERGTAVGDLLHVFS